MANATMGSRLRNRFVKVGSAPYDAGNTSTIKLPQGTLFSRLKLRLSGSLNITVALTGLSLAPAGLIRKLELVADGQTLWAADARDLYELARHLSSKAGALVFNTAVGAAQPFEVAFPVFWEAIRRQSPADSLFWSEPYGQLELKITWAAAVVGSIASAGTASVNSTTKLDVSLEDTFEGHEQVGLIKRISFIERTVSAVSAEFEIPLGRSGLLDFALIRVDIDGVFSDAVINSVRFQFDSSFEPIKSITWADLQNKGVEDMSIDGGAAGTGRVAGIALVDLVQNGMLTGAPNLKAMTDPKLILDVNNPAGTTKTIRVTLVTYDLAPSAIEAAS